MKKVKILGITRMKNSTNGNPRYQFIIQDDEGTEIRISKSDAGFCYAVGNPGMRVGDMVEIELTKPGRISHMQPVSK